MVGRFENVDALLFRVFRAFPFSPWFSSQTKPRNTWNYTEYTERDLPPLATATFSAEAFKPGKRQLICDVNQ